MARSLLVAALATGLSQVVLATNVEHPPCVDQFKPFESVGCFSDANPPALVMRSKVGQGDMTVGKCATICKGNGFRYAGLKYYGVCFCGAVINGTPADEGQCNLPCNGNKQETCGGNKALSIWEDSTFPKKPDEVAVEDYKPIGCYTDNSSSGRALSYPVKVDGSSLTPQKCIAACKSQGFAYAGTEFGGECWCAPAPSADTKKVSDSECNVPCNGEKSSTCGGRSRLTVYKAKDLESTEPCKGNPPVSSASTIPPSSVPGSPSAPTSTGPDSTGPACGIVPPPSGPASSTGTAPTESAPTGPAPTGPAPSGPSSTGPIPSEPVSTGPPALSTGPTPSEPVSTGPTPPASSTGPTPPVSTGPSSTGPTPSEPVSTSPTPPASSTGPTPPVSTGPSSTGPTPSEPVSTGPASSTGPSPPVTTNPTSTRTWTTTTLCASVVTTTPKCEKQIGDWCAPPIPDWSDKIGCLHSAVACKIQLGACFKKAGVQNAIKCFEYGKFCEEVKSCCLGCISGSCSKRDCKPSAVTVTTITKPCAAATTTQAPPTNTPVCPPKPENVCVDIGKAVCGVPLPAVSCNDVKADFGSNPFKLYTDEVSSKCWSFPLPKVPEACAQACKEQYDECQKYDFWNCASGKRSESGAVPRVVAKPGDVNRRTLNFDHLTKCKVQYDACLVANKKVNPADKCKTYGC